MAFTLEQQMPQLYGDFIFYDSGFGDDGVYNESVEFLDEDKTWKLTAIRLHMTSTITSVASFTVYISSIWGSRHNYIFVSEALNGVIDYQLNLSLPYPLLSDDQLVFHASLASGIFAGGIKVEGKWSVKT